MSLTSRLMRAVGALAVGALAAGCEGGSGGGGGGGGSGPATGQPSVTFTTASSGLAGESATGVVTARLTLPATIQTLASPITFRIDRGGTATSTDVAPTPAQVTFAAGSPSGARQDIALTAIQDTLVEGPETLTLTLVPRSGGGVVGNHATHQVTLSDDEAATVAFAAAASALGEAGGAHDVAVRLTITPPTATLASSLTVDVATQATGTATSPADFSGAPATVTFSAGAGDGATQVVTLTLVDDTLIEGPETIALALQSATASAGVGAPATHTVTIADTDAAVVAFTTVSSSAGEATGTHDVSITLTTTPAGATLAAALTVDALQVAGAASAPSDYTGAPVTISFPAASANGATQDLTLTLVDDVLVEGSEAIALRLQDASAGGSIAPGDHTITIVDSDAASVALTLSASSVGEGAGTHDVSVSLVTSPAGATLAAALTVDVSATGGTAVDPDDFVAPLAVTFPAASASGATQNATVTLVDDDLVEGSETVTLALQNVSANGTLTAGTHTITLTDSDSAAVSFAVAASTPGEADGTHDVTVILTTTPAAATLAAALTVDVAQTGGSATTPADFAGTPTTVTFAATSGNGATQAATLTVEDDALHENPSETVVLSLQNVSAPAAITPGTHTVTIVDDDNADPVFAFSGGVELQAATGDEVRFTVTLSDTDGDPCTLRLLEVPPACVFTPAAAGVVPITRTVTWRVQPSSLGRQRLLFEADDGLTTVRAVVTVNVVGGSAGGIHDGVVIGDVTGDGALDVVAVARFADLAVVDAGAVYVWAGTTIPGGPPTATLRVSTAVAGDALGHVSGQGLQLSGQGVQLADVTGDGTLDVLVAASGADVAVTSSGAAYVWAGGPALTGVLDPTAVLRVSTASFGDFMGVATGQGALLGDVTGDGILDVVIAATEARGAFSSTGAVYVWAGGATLTGTLDPTAALRVATAAQADRLASATGQGVLLADVTDDGTLDVIASAQFADVVAVDTGAVYVWAGGAGLVGTLDPTATLRVSTAAAGDALAAAAGQGVVLGDVTGDGSLDLVVAATFADGTAADTGAVYVWAGGAGLVGTLDPTATLRVATLSAGSKLGSASGNSVTLGHVTGDGTLDVIVGAAFAPVGGAVFVWAGGAGLVGVLDPTATLSVPTAVFNDTLGSASGRGVLLGDVTDDGTLDLVVAASQATEAATESGAVYVWAGGASLVGSLAPTATLRVSTAATDDRLGNGKGQAVILDDVTADGVLDVIASAMLADGTVANAGAVYVWAGGTGLVGTLDPTATLRVATAVANDQLGSTSGQGLILADVTGDGAIDVVVGTQAADVAAADAGAIYVWAGGPGLAGVLDPTATLRVSTSAVDDQLGRASGQAIVFGDVTGDGALDVIAVAAVADGSAVNVGAAYVWTGGAALAGPLDPTATLRVSTAAPVDSLGEASGQGVHLADVTGDGTLDVIIGAGRADGAFVDTGAVYVWAGAALVGTLDPTGTLRVPTASTSDRLAD